MAKSTEWTKEAYEASVTSRAWAATPYDAGWDGSRKRGEDLPASAELRGIFAEEMALDAVPDWANQIVDDMIGPLPMCGHYAFPRPLLQVCEAIGAERRPEFVFGCYTADSGRKVLMSYYVYCLDAWLKAAPLDVAKAELAMRDDLGKGWSRIVAAIYETLGARSGAKALAVRRLIHRLRWWIKTLIWPDDKRDRFLLDVYSGDARGGGVKWSFYGNPPFGDPYFTERDLPEIQEISRKICETLPDGKKLLGRIEGTWLCAPKVFRYLEKIIIEIGSIGTDRAPDAKAAILECEDTYPDVASHKKWYASFMSSVTAWLAGEHDAVSGLGGATPVKHWLVRLLRHKLELYERHNPFGRLVGAKPGGAGK